MSKHSPLHAVHEAAGAKFAEFGGWSMPLEYAGSGADKGGVVSEHTAVREGVGIFDVSHLGKATVSGPGTLDFLNRCLSGDLNKIVDGKAQYTLLCTDDGGVIDDLIAYRFSPERIFLMPNAANTEAVVARLRAELGEDSGIEIVDQHEDFAVLAVQGPKSDETLAGMGLPTGHDYMSFETAELPGEPEDRGPISLTVCRTGYTGERGYELVVPSERAEEVWNQVMAAGKQFGIRPCGLGARDTLRTEMGYPLHGQDISPEISPVQARLGWAIGWKKDAFIGHEALRAEKEAGPRRRLWGLKAVGRGIPRPGMVVLDADGTEVGTVTSGTFSPTLKTGIALALVDSALGEGDQVQVQIRNRTEPFEVVKPPLVTPGVRGS